MLSQEQIQSNKERFKSLILEAAQLNTKKAEGLNRFLAYLEETDFYVSPASSKYHQNYEGGLVEHSLSVFDHLNKLLEAYNISEEEISRYSRIIVALCHDICKIGRYRKSYKTLPKKDENGIEIKDQYGKLIWEKQEIWDYEPEHICLGHSALSLYLIQHFIMLSEKEAEAIFNHMSWFEISDYHTKSEISLAFTHNKLAYFLHQADMNDTYLGGIAS